MLQVPFLAARCWPCSIVRRWRHRFDGSEVGGEVRAVQCERGNNGTPPEAARRCSGALPSFVALRHSGCYWAGTLADGRADTDRNPEQQSGSNAPEDLVNPTFFRCLFFRKDNTAAAGGDSRSRFGRVGGMSSAARRLLRPRPRSMYAASSGRRSEWGGLSDLPPPAARGPAEGPAGQAGLSRTLSNVRKRCNGWASCRHFDLAISSSSLRLFHFVFVTSSSSLRPHPFFLVTFPASSSLRPHPSSAVPVALSSSPWRVGAAERLVTEREGEVRY